MLEKILLGLFKGFFMALGWIIQSIFRLLKDAIQRKSRDVYSAPAQVVTPREQRSVSSALTILPPLVDPDGSLTSVDSAIANAQYKEALNEIVLLAAKEERLAEWHFNLAHRCLELWRQWSVSMPEPKRDDFEEGDVYLSQARSRDEKLSGALEEGCKNIEKVFALDAGYQFARLLGRELHGKLAYIRWAWGPKGEGFFHQKRVIELSDELIDYDVLDLAQRCALEAGIFGSFFDMTESLFKEGKIEAGEHFYAAMVYEGAIHDEKWPLSGADKKRMQEFIRAALAHLEYCERHKLEQGPHWHNIMARVLACRGQFEDATYHFGQFKSMAVKEKNGEAMIAMFGNPTVKIIKACLNKRR